MATEGPTTGNYSCMSMQSQESVKALPTERRPKKLLDQVRDAIRRKHYSPRTEESYVQWIKRFIVYHHMRHPKDMGTPEIEAFLTYLVDSAWMNADVQRQTILAQAHRLQELLRLSRRSLRKAIR